MGNNIEKRLEKLEDYVPEEPGKLIPLLSKLDGFKAKYGLGDNPSEEEVQEILDRMRSHSKSGALQSNRRRLYD